MEKLRAEDVQRMLCKQDRNVTLEQAGLILDFLRGMASIAVGRHLEQVSEKKLTDEGEAT